MTFAAVFRVPPHEPLPKRIGTRWDAVQRVLGARQKSSLEAGFRGIPVGSKWQTHIRLALLLPFLGLINTHIYVGGGGLKELQPS